MDPVKIGIGYDVHRLAAKRKLIIGGIEIPFEKGLLGHSDADVLLHAIMDAILGALGKGDIGKWFPPDDDRFAGADSRVLLEEVAAVMHDEGYRLGNLDAIVIAQAPKMAPYIPAMRKTIAAILHADKSAVNIKATTEEKLGFTGKGEGISAQAAVCLYQR